MADKNFGQFTNQTSPATGDFVVGYRGTSEQRYTLHAVSGLIVGAGGDGQGVTSAKNLGSAPSLGLLSGVAGSTGIWLKSLSGKGSVALTQNDSTLFISGSASSVWTQDGSDINYTAGQVLIGTTDKVGGNAALILSGVNNQLHLHGRVDEMIGMDFISTFKDPVFNNDRVARIGQRGNGVTRDNDSTIGLFDIQPGASNDIALGGSEQFIVRTPDRTTTPYTLRTFVGDPEWDSGGTRLHELYVSGKLFVSGGAGDWVQITGNGGGGSSPWTQAGSDIYYSAGAVGIGTTNPTKPLSVQDLTANQTLAHFSGGSAAGGTNLVQVSSFDGTNDATVYLQAGFGNTRGGGLYTPSNRSLTMHIGAKLVAAMTGTTFMIGNDDASAQNHIVADRPGLLVLGDTDDGEAKIDLLSTGSIAATNRLSFISASILANNRWGIIQDNGSAAGSNLTLGYKTGGSTVDPTTDGVLVLTSGKHVLPGTSGTQNLGAADKSWATGFFDDLYVSGVRITGNGAGGDSSPLTTKGDLYGFTTENARIPIGSNNQVLTADSTEALGVKWADSSAGCAVADWVEAFEEDVDGAGTFAGDLKPVDNSCINDTMWMLTSAGDLTLRANHFRYNWGPGAFTEDISF